MSPVEPHPGERGIDAIAAVDPAATAFYHRQEPYMLNFEANWEEPAADDENVAWVRESIEAARALPGVAGGYGNFPGFREDPARALFGENYDRLVAVKTSYDPENVFHHNQNVEPATDDRPDGVGRDSDPAGTEKGT